MNASTRPRSFVAVAVAGVAAAALFVVLVHGVLVAAHVAEPAATTVHGLTSRRLWATTVAGVALVSTIAGGLGLTRALRGDDATSARRRAIVGVVAGLVAAVNGALVVLLASGGPGTGNGVVGGAAALVLGVIGIVLGALALSRASAHAARARR